MSVFNMHFSVRDQMDRFRKDFQLCLLHHSSLKHLRCVTLLNFYCFLQDDLASIGSLIYKMNGRADYFNTSCKRCLMHF